MYLTGICVTLDGVAQQSVYANAWKVFGEVSYKVVVSRSVELLLMLNSSSFLQA